VKRRTRVVGVLPSEKSLTNLATAVMLRAGEGWAFRRFLDVAPCGLWRRNPQESRLDPSSYSPLT